MNQFKIKKAFSSGEDALKYAEEINEKLLKVLSK
jgi:hypothetical protein